MAMFSSIKESEKVRRGEDGGGDEIGDDLKKIVRIPFLGILAEAKKCGWFWLGMVRGLKV